jgi:hypothetical protein
MIMINKEHRLRVSENMMSRIIFGRKRKGQEVGQNFLINKFIIK